MATPAPMPPRSSFAPGRLRHRIQELPWGAAVWLAGLVLAGIMTSYVVRFGQNLPIQDEWWFIPVLFGDEAKGEWLFARHNEHRYLAGRAVYLMLHLLSGGDFRAGMVVSLVLLSASAFVLLWSARRARGRLVPADIWLPVLLLNGAHGENLTMGYQVVVTLTTASVAGMLAVVMTSGERSPVRSALLGAPLLVLIVLGGAPGVTFGPPLALWIGYLGWRGWREQRPGQGGSVAAIILLAVLALGYCAWVLGDVVQRPTGHAKNPPQVMALRTLEFLTVGLGTAGRYAWPVFGYVVGTLYGVAIVGLTVIAFRRAPERPVALGLLAVILGTVASGVAVGWTRTIAMESRYTSLSCLGLAAIALASARYVPWRPFFLVRSVLLVGLAIWFLRENWADGRLYAHVYRHRIQELKRDTDRGVPLEFLADRHVIFPIPEYRANFRLLRDRGFPPLARVPDAPPMTMRELPVPSGMLPPWERPTDPPRVEYRLDPPVHVLAIRIHYRCDYARYWQQFRLSWQSEDRPDAAIQTAESHPWIVPGDGVLAFWIDGPVERFWLSPDSATPGLPMTRVTLYLPRDGP